jgi:HAD superfamily hydrolase (TIGR01549 family)
MTDKIKVIIFDLQGTLIENGVFPSPIKQVKHIMDIKQSFHSYVPVFEQEFMTKQYNNLSEAFSAVAENFSIDMTKSLTERLVGLWNKNKILSKPFPEAIDCLESLKEYKLILAANMDCFSKEIIQKFDLEKYFDKIFISCDIGYVKNNPEFFKIILQDLKIDPEKAIVVGDSIESDMKAAQAAGIKGILIDRNNRMEYPDKISSLNELKELLK